MEEFNSDERFLVPDSEDDDLNSREPWDLVSGLEALTSPVQSRFILEEHDVNVQQNMSVPHRRKSEIFPACDSSESGGEFVEAKKTLAYDTVSSDMESGENSHNQTVIERKNLDEKTSTDKEISTPSEHIKNLHFSQDVILVPETLDTVDDAAQSPNVFHTAPFVVPDSPSQENVAADDDNIGESQPNNDIGLKLLSSNSQASSKIGSQGLHLHLSQSQLESSQNAEDDAVNATTPIKDSKLSLSCRKLTLKGAPPSPQREDSLPRPSFHLPSKLILSASEEETGRAAEPDNTSERTGGKASDMIQEPVRYTKKQRKVQRLFFDTEEDAKSAKESSSSSHFVANEQRQTLESLKDYDAADEPSLVFTEEHESVVVVDDDHTMSYDHIPVVGQSQMDARDKQSDIKGDGRPVVLENKEFTESQAEFDGFEEDVRNIVETVVSNLENATEKQKNQSEMLPATGQRDDLLIAPSSQLASIETTKCFMKRPSKNMPENCVQPAFSDVSLVTASHGADPYRFQESQSQNVADISNQAQSDRSKFISKAGGKEKVVKVMRKVFKKKVVPRKDKSSSTDESGSNRATRSDSFRKRLSGSNTASKAKVKTLKKMGNKNARKDEQPEHATEEQHAATFTTLQSKTSDSFLPVTSTPSTLPVTSSPLTLPVPVCPTSSSQMPPPLARRDSSRNSHVIGVGGSETSPQEHTKFSKRSSVVSFQEDSLPKGRLGQKDLPEPIAGEIERKTVREFKAIVVERETIIDILDHNGKIVKQTILKEVTRTPLDPPGLSMSPQITERVLSPAVSPSRSVSTGTSGDLADISSSSLSRSISSGSKGSNPSLDFCSQSYPTPAQRSPALESAISKVTSTSDEAANALIKKSTVTVPSSTAPKLDNKRLSSGSNTGQDLFASPDESLIQHCDGSHFNIEPLSSSSTLINAYSSLTRRPSDMTEEVNLHLKKATDSKNTESKTKGSGKSLNEKESSQPVMETDSIVTEPVEDKMREDNQRKTQSESRQGSSPSKGRGKRKIEERPEPKETQTRKKARQETVRDEGWSAEADGGEVSESGLSTGFVAQETVMPSIQGSPTGVSSKSNENEGCQEQRGGGEMLSMNVEKVELIDIKSKAVIGEKVMGKWTDGFYYPGVLKKIETASQRYQVKFDDGTQRWLGPEGLLLVKDLPVGQSVMVMKEDGYYECGMILDHSWTAHKDGKENTLIYSVERDDGVTQKCQRKCLLLSEDQAACLISDHDVNLPFDTFPTAATKAGDISLDNLVEGKRQHRARKAASTSDADCAESKTSNVTTGEEETASTSHEGQEQPRSSRKRKVGPVATSTPTPKLTSKTMQKTCTPIKFRNVGVLGSVVSSPSGSRKYRKTRQGLFGQKLSTPSNLFKGLTFLLTHVEKTEEQRQEEKWILGYSSLEDTSLDENPDDNEEVHPFVKEQLQSLIEEGGGKVVEMYDEEEIQKAEPSSCYLIAAEHQRTVKYLQALSGNITIISHEWILHSINEGKLLGLKAFLLPAGISLEKKKLMECKSTCTQLMNLTILLVSNRNEFIAAWASILSVSKCRVATKFPSKASKADPGVDYVVSDATCPPAIVRKCKNLDVPLVSSEWVAQCLINNCLVAPSSHEKYQHDYGLVATEKG